MRVIQTLIIPAICAVALPASAQDPFVPLPLSCEGTAPDWIMDITKDGTSFEYRQRIEADLNIAWETQAEGVDWPRALTLIGRGTSAIVILEAPSAGTHPIRILTQQGETPLLLVGSCRGD